MATDLKKIGGLLILIGGILGLLFGILGLLGMGIALLPSVDLAFLGIIGSIILIVLSLIVLATSGVIKIAMLKMDNTWVINLILGILMYIFGGGLGAILVIIGAILYMIK